jgi:hypothetical protein
MAGTLPPALPRRRARLKSVAYFEQAFSFPQIQAARIWHACGWPDKKILENLRKMDSKDIGTNQLERLLREDTYASIPDVLM